MALNLKLQAKLSQQLALTPQLQLSIKILQMNHLELKESIEMETQVNPLLEIKDNTSKESKDENFDFDRFFEGYTKISEDFAAKDKFSFRKVADDEDDETNFENYVYKKPDLYSHLLWQLHLENITKNDVMIGEEIIGNIDPDGYLRVDINEIAEKINISPSEVERVLKIIQHFDPIGIGARNLKECLLIQLEVYQSPLPFVKDIVENHLEDLSRKNFKKIAKDLNITPQDVENAFNYINSLNPKPGRGYEFSSYETQMIEPDVFVVKEDGEYKVFLNYDGMPSLRINKKYEMLLKNKDLDAEAKNFIKDKIKAAYWFIKSVHQRGNTVERVAKAIVERQKDFFEKGVSFMKPMTLRDLAEELELHESTISRVTSNKFMLTPVGLFEMKYFFGTAIRKIGSEDVSSITVKELIKEIIEGENSNSPYSDQEISDILKSKGYNIARRTVTKYRESMNILSSGLRKSYKEK